MKRMTYEARKSGSRTKGPDPVDVHVGDRLRLRRNTLGLSQKQLGKAAGLTFQQIQKYERGTNRMGASRLFQLARILDIPVVWFFEDMASGPGIKNRGFAESGQTPLEGAPPGLDQVMSRRETAELLRAWYRIADPKQRRKTLGLIKAMGAN